MDEDGKIDNKKNIIYYIIIESEKTAISD